MDSISKAVEMARATTSPQAGASVGGLKAPDNISNVKTVLLDSKHLESCRILVPEANDLRGNYYDMLRTQVLHEMDENGWQFLAVTSATPECGKSVTACNLALSIARLSDRSVLLVDMDMHKPKVTEYLGLKSQHGLLSLLEGRSNLENVLIDARLGRTSMLVLPGEVCRSGASELMASQTMSTLLQSIKREFRSRLVIFDMPPMLIGDDVISVLPQLQSVLLVAGVGQTSVADIKSCQKHLKGTPVVRVVVNRTTEPADSYHAYY